MPNFSSTELTLPGIRSCTCFAAPGFPRNIVVETAGTPAHEKSRRRSWVANNARNVSTALTKRADALAIVLLIIEVRISILPVLDAQKENIKKSALIYRLETVKLSRQENEPANHIEFSALRQPNIGPCLPATQFYHKNVMMRGIPHPHG